MYNIYVIHRNNVNIYQRMAVVNWVYPNWRNDIVSQIHRLVDYYCKLNPVFIYIDCYF